MARFSASGAPDGADIYSHALRGRDQEAAKRWTSSCVGAADRVMKNLRHVRTRVV